MNNLNSGIHRLGASTWAYVDQAPLDQTLTRLARLGYRHVDILARPPHLWPSDLDAGQRKAIRQHLSGEGLTLEALVPPATDHNLCSPTREMRDFSVGIMKNVMDLCADLGGAMMTTIPGRGPSFKPFSAQDYWDWTIEGIGKLLPHAERTGIRIAMENHHITPFPTMASLVKILDYFQHPSLCIAYDVANAEFVGEDHAEAVRIGQNWLYQVHLSDCTRSRWDHGAIGTGDIDFAAFSRALTDTGFAGTSVVEIVSDTPDTDFADAVPRLVAMGWAS